MKVYTAVMLSFLALGLLGGLLIHGTYSFFMTYAFAIPLLCWIVPGIMLYSRLPLKFPEISIVSYDAAIITCSLGLLITGLMRKFGTKSVFEIVFYALGIILLGISVGIYYMNSDHED